MRGMRCILLLASVMVVFPGADSAKAQSVPPQLSGFPSNLIWQNQPAAWSTKDNSLTLTAGKKTDWFLWPGGGYTADSSPRLMFKPATDFMFSTKVDVTAHTTYDAGCIALYESSSVWAKLCLEAQNDKRLAVISVVTRGRSDDATSFPVGGTSIYLKAAQADGVIFFYASEDGKQWTIVRKFHFEVNNGLWAGFSAQSPDGDGARALFTEFGYSSKKVNLWELR